MVVTGGMFVPPSPPALLQITRARLLGMALLAVIVVVHNLFIVTGFSTGWSLMVAAVLVGYGALARLLLLRCAGHALISPLNDALLALDIGVWTFAIYGTGGERSWLVFLLILRAIDQAPFGFRRAVTYAHVSVAAYAGLAAWLTLVEGRPLPWSAEAGKIAVIWLANVYVCAVALIVDRLRTRRREAEAALRESEERLGAELHKLHAVIEAIPNPTFYKDEQGIYRGCNAAFLAYLGKTREAIIGKSVYDLSPPDLAEVYHKADVALFEARGSQTYETNVVYADGTRHDVIFYKAAFFNADASLGGLVGSILDITERKQREREATRLYEVTAQLTGAREMTGVLELVTRSATDLLGCDTAAVLRYDRTREGLVPVSDVNLPPAMREAVIRPGEGVTGRAFATREPVWARDLTAERHAYSDAPTATAVHTGPARGTLAVPIVTGETTYGVLAVGFAAAHEFTPDEVRLLTSFAHQAAMAIEKQALLEGAEDRQQLAETLADLARSVAQGGELPHVHQRVVEGVRALLKADIARLYDLDAEAREIVLRATSGGQAGAGTAAERIPVGQGVTGRCVAERRPVMSSDLLHDPALVLPEAMRGELQSSVRRAYLGVPLIIEGQVIGALSVGARGGRTFTPEEVQLAQTFADQAGVAIERARLLREAAERSLALEKLYREARAQELEATKLFEVTAGLAAARDVDTVLDLITVKAVELLGCDAAGILRYHRDRDCLTFVRGENLAPGLRAVVVRPGDGISGRAFSERAPVWTSDLVAAPLVYADKKTEDTIRSIAPRAVLGVPIVMRDSAWGVLTVYFSVRHDFLPSEIRMVTSFAHQAALAIDTQELLEETRAARESAEVATRAKSEFLANMSHELRTPLNAIIGYSEMLQEDAADRRQLELVPDLQRIHAAGRHLLQLINEVLDLSKIEAGKMDLYLETFEVAALLDEVQATIQPLAQNNHNTLRLDYGSALGTIHTDQVKLRQALFNLLSNACKFTTRGTIELSATRGPGTGGDWFTFRVSDTGIGMTTEQMGRLFQPFTQADASTTRKYGGTGLGLTISRRFCQMMGGDIIARSAPGAGSAFTIRIPAAPADAAETVARALEPAAAQGGESGAKVLVIDDDASVRELLTRFLTKEGFRVSTAANGEDGLRLAHLLRPAAITLDVMMPGMDGWTVLSRLKADATVADIPVVMLTIIDDRNHGYMLGASDYLMKPVDRDRLLTLLRRYQDDDRAVRVLVVDDDAATRAVMRTILERDGWSVTEADNGRVALDEVAREQPNLILLDLNMPVMDGFEFVSELRRRPDAHAVRIVVMTSRDVDDDDRRRLNGGVERVLQKASLSREELLRVLREILASAQRTRRSA